MESFSTVVSICSGVMVILTLIGVLVKPIREWFTRSKERDEAQKKRDEELKETLDRRDKEIEIKFDRMQESIGKVEQEVKDLREDSEETKAVNARTKILRFADEVYEGVRHSKEHFDSILTDAIPHYNQYCESHPNFRNDQTVLAQQRIRDVYAKCLKNHGFLGDEPEVN